jgi:D-3-phosphoglycerate dehydrogenase
VPETDQTRGLVNTALLELMRPEACLVNCARAGIVDEDALRLIKTERRLSFCTDVYPEDGPGPKSVGDIADIMLPHLGASTREANQNAARRAAEQIVAYVDQGVTKYVVNKGVPDGLDAQYQELGYHIALVLRHYSGGARALRRIECVFYGGLAEFSKWLVPPIVAGLCPDFVARQDPRLAEDYLAEKGISLEVQAADESKQYGNAMTVDVLEGNEDIKQISVRGTITEGNLMISRINKFDKLYFQPQGNSLIVVYRDRPGQLAKITAACAAADINIEDIRAPHDPESVHALAVLKTNAPVPNTVLEQLQREMEPLVAFAMSVPAP